MFKLTRSPFLLAFLLFLCSSTLFAQGRWTVSATGGARATVVAAGTVSDGRADTMWRAQPIGNRNPLVVETTLPNKGWGLGAAGVSLRSTSWSQRLNLASWVGRSLFRGFHRTRVVGINDATWTYRGRTPNSLERFDFVLKLRGDVGEDLNIQLIHDVIYPNVILNAGEVGDLAGMVSMDIPNVGVITGVLIGEGVMWMGPPGSFVVSPDGNSATVSNIVIQNGQQVDVDLDGLSNLILRPDRFNFPRLNSLITGEFEVRRARSTGPPTL